MKKIIYKTETGIAIITPVDDHVKKVLDAIIPEVIKDNKIVTPKRFIYKDELIIGLELAKKDVPEGVDYKIIDDSEIPLDRTFRDAWTYELKEDIPKSKEIWKNKLRAERKPLLEALDVEFIKAQEEKKNTASIVARKQELRDITKKVDAAKTIASIKKVII